LKEQKLSLTVIMPVYSEEETIIEIVEYLLKNLPQLIQEVILVYHPNSSDKCLKILNNLNTKYEKVRIIHQRLDQKGGNGIAYRQGFKEAQGTHILMIDSDGEMDVTTVPLMIKKLNETNSSIVIASRYVKGGGLVGYAIYKSIVNPIFHLIFKFLFSTKVKDLTCGFKIIKTELIKKYNWVAKYQDIAFETTLRPL